MEYKARICKLKKWNEDYGYGFSLVANKGTIGQFISDVEKGSPAYHGGLKANDFLVEVNGFNILSESHLEVVERIKSNKNQVELLVLDPATREYFENNSISMNRSEFLIETIICPSHSPSIPSQSDHGSSNQNQFGSNLEIPNQTHLYEIPKHKEETYKESDSFESNSKELPRSSPMLLSSTISISRQKKQDIENCPSTHIQKLTSSINRSSFERRPKRCLIKETNKSFKDRTQLFENL